MKWKILLGFLPIITFADDNCIIDRAGFYLGPHITSYQLAKVDICRNKIIEMKSSDSFPVEYHEFKTEFNGDLVIPPFFMYQALYKMMANLKKNDIDCNVISCSGVATSGLRDVTNSNAYLRFLKDKLNLKIIKIDAEKESKLRYLSVISNSKLKPEQRKNLILIDYQQDNLALTYMQDGEPKVELIDFYPEKLRLKILTKIKLAQTDKITPLDDDQINQAITIARKEFALTILASDKISKLIKSSKNVYLIGEQIVKGVLPLAISQEKSLGKVELLNSMTDLSNKQDDYIKLEDTNNIYKTEDIINDLIFTYCLIEILKLDDVRVIDFADDTTGVLLLNELWE